MARSILREPLIHFVVAGLILFGLNQLFFEQPSQTSNGIDCRGSGGGGSIYSASSEPLA